MFESYNSWTVTNLHEIIPNDILPNDIQYKFIKPLLEIITEKKLDNNYIEIKNLNYLNFELNYVKNKNHEYEFPL